MDTMNILTSIAIGLAASYIVAEVYRTGTTNEQKSSWQNYVKTHHGEAGVLMALSGLIAKSPTLIGSGLGLAYHDRKDVDKWFS